MNWFQKVLKNRIIRCQILKIRSQRIEYPDRAQGGFEGDNKLHVLVLVLSKAKQLSYLLPKIFASKHFDNFNLFPIPPITQDFECERSWLELG